MPYCDDFWHIDGHENILSSACLTVFVKSKTENQLIRFVCNCLFVIAYLVADNNVKCETVAATRDRRLHHSRPRFLHCLLILILWITGYVEYCSIVFIGNLLKTERWWTEVASDWSVAWHPAKYRWSGNWPMASSPQCMRQSQRKAYWKHAVMCCSTTVKNLLWNLHSVIFCFTTFNQSWLLKF